MPNQRPTPSSREADDMNRMRNKALPESESISVKNSIILAGQLGVITKQEFKKGKILFSVKGPILPRATKYSFSVDLDRHIDPLRDNGSFDFGRYLNHSCDPNTIVRVVDAEKKFPYIEIVARRNIKAGEELAFDYALLEYETVANNDCKCTTALCRGTIHGFKDLPDHIVKKYKAEGLIPKNFVKIKNAAF